MSPKLPTEEQYWSEATIEFWTKHYSTTNLALILRLLKLEFPENTYRLPDGTLEALTHH